MEADPIFFFKSFEQRLKELKEILNGKSESHFASGSTLKDLWTIYLDFFIEPVGWQTLWKINREICMEFNLKFPTEVVAIVDGVNTTDLTANITVTNVENKIDIPKKFVEISLMELYPITQQEDVLLIRNTAEAIDHLRLFYTYLFYPWEVNDDEENWIENHLEKRLRLHYEIISARIFHETVDQIQELIKKGKTAFKEIKQLEEVIEDMDDASSNPNTLKLFELNHELDHIKNQLSIFDDPILRNQKVAANRANLLKKRQNSAYFSLTALLPGTTQSYMQCLNEIKLLVNPETFICVMDSIQQAFNLLTPNETVLIGPGVHQLQNSRALQEDNSAVRGIMEADKCIISEKEDNWSLFDLLGTETKLHHLTIRSSRVQCLVVLRRGVCRLDNVVLEGSHSAVGVIVHRGATLYATRCSFVGCTIGLIANPGSIVILTECNFKQNKIGIEVQKNSDVMIESCTITDSSEYAVQVNQSEIPRMEGSIDLITISGSVNIKDLTLARNFGDVFVECVKPTEQEI